MWEQELRARSDNGNLNPPGIHRTLRNGFDCGMGLLSILSSGSRVTPVDVWLSCKRQH